MFNQGTWSPERQFADQFERTSSGYVYRRNRRGPAIAVSTGERDEFVTKFRRDSSVLRWVFFAGCLVGLVVIIVIASRFENPPGIGWLTFFAVAVPGFIYLWIGLWISDAPARALRGRECEAPALSNGEYGRQILARMTYRQLAGLAFAAVIFAVFVSMDNDPREGWNALWLLAPGFGLSVACIQSIRKWRLERGRK